MQEAESGVPRIIPDHGLMAFIQATRSCRSCCSSRPWAWSAFTPPATESGGNPTCL